MVCGNELAYTDTYSGKVCVVDTADLAKTKARYTVFAINDGDMSTPNDPKQRFTLVEVDRKTGRRREWLYPESEGRTVFTRGLYTENGKVRPYEVLKGGDGPVIRVFAAD